MAGIASPFLNTVDAIKATFANISMLAFRQAYGEKESPKASPGVDQLNPRAEERANPKAVDPKENQKVNPKGNPRAAARARAKENLAKQNQKANGDPERHPSNLTPLAVEKEVPRVAKIGPNHLHQK